MNFCLYFDIAVALHIVSLSRFAVVADRYAYLSLAGVCFVVAWLFWRVIAQKTNYRKAIIGVFALYVMCIGAYAHTRTYVWRNTESIKRELKEMIEQRDDFNKLKKHE